MEELKRRSTPLWGPWEYSKSKLSGLITRLLEGLLWAYSTEGVQKPATSVSDQVVRQRSSTGPPCILGPERRIQAPGLSQVSNWSWTNFPSASDQILKVIQKSHQFSSHGTFIRTGYRSQSPSNFLQEMELLRKQLDNADEVESKVLNSQLVLCRELERVIGPKEHKYPLSEGLYRRCKEQCAHFF